MLNTCIASSDYDLTTTSALKALIFGATATSTAEDAHLSNAIRRASRWAESYVGYPLSAQFYQEFLSGYETRRLMLSRTPVRAVPRMFDSTSTEDGTQVHTSEVRLEREAGFLTRDEGWGWSVPVEGDMTDRPRVGMEFQPWLVDYIAGYTYAGIDTGSDIWSTVHGSTSTGRTLPEDIEQAVLLRAMEVYEGEGVDAEQLGDLKVTYNLRSGSEDAGEPYEQLLEPYRRFI